MKKTVTLTIPEGAEHISEAFGIQDGYVREIFNLKEPEFQSILYITGESGSGKSTILNEFYEETKVSFDESKPIFSLIDNEPMKWLSFVGLGDAVLYVTPFKYLSDSQQKRFIILKMILENDIIVVDEFLSTLDRKTAKSVAFTFQKLIRKLNKRAVVATAHDDLTDYLMPSVKIHGKAFPSKFETTRYIEGEFPNPFQEVEFEYVDKDYYRILSLGELHYRGKYTGGTKEYLIAKFNNETIGVLVSTNLIGREGRRISRVVVHPSYRGCGIGKAIVTKYIEDYPLTEVIAVMAKYNPVFDKAGMIRVDDSIVKSPPHLKGSLKELDFNFKKWHDLNYCNQVASDRKFREKLSEFSKHAKKYVQPGGRHLETEEIAMKIKNEPYTAGRVLWQFREKKYAKYITNEMWRKRNEN